MGQGAGGKGSGTGMSQREQKEVLGGFRSGAFNTLVATCIGEEGLDIPQVCSARALSLAPDASSSLQLPQPGRRGCAPLSGAGCTVRCAACSRSRAAPLSLCLSLSLHSTGQVDLIICYDVSASPTRSIQRMGRTGRHKQGRVVYILAAGREAEQYTKNEEARCGPVWLLLGRGGRDSWPGRARGASCWHLLPLPTQLPVLARFPTLCTPPPSAPQNTQKLHHKLRRGGFDMCALAPRMLPHAYEPQRLDVLVEHTPEKVR